MTTKKVLRGLGSFLVPFSIMLLIWHSLAIAPFGDNNLLVSDIGTQYLEFMSLFKRFFDEGISLYSFSNGIGGSIEALSGYYLISPYNLICLFFQDENLPIALIWIITAKIATMGSTMYFYLGKHFKRPSFATIIFSTAYSLCGFVVAYSLNFMWLDALILLPLVTLGLEKLWRKETGSLYGITLFATIVTNYYLGYMVCLYAVIYSIYLYWLANPTRDAWRIKTLWQEWCKFLVVSFLAGIATSFILLPSLVGMLRTAKTNFDPQSFVLAPRFAFSAFGELGIGTYQFDARLQHLPTMYSGILMVLLFISYFFCRSISKRERRGTFVLMFALFLSFIVQLINTVWHMFQSPAGFPYRNVFIFSFLIVRFAYAAWLQLQENSDTGKMIGKSALGFSLILLLARFSLNVEKSLSDRWFIGKELPGEFTYLWYSLALIWIYALLIYLLQKKNYRWLVVLMAGITFYELGFNYQQALKAVPFGSQKNFAKFYDNQSELIDELNASPTLWRINEKTDQSSDGFSIAYNSYNDSFLYNFADISSYTSTLEKDVLDTLVDLGIYSRNVRRFTYVDENPVLNLLLNVRYSIKPQALTDRVPLKEAHNMYVYQNPEALGMGLLIENNQVKLQTGKVIENQENILQSLKKQEKHYFQPAKIEANTVNNTLTLQTSEAGELFMYLPKVRWKQVDQLLVNGEKHQESIGIQTNQLFNLGHFKAGETVTVELKGDKEFNFNQAEIATLEDASFNQLLADKNELAFDLMGQRDDQLYGEVTADKNDQALYLSIPYDDAWQVYVDQQKVPTQKVFGSFLSVQVPKGKHQLRLVYRPTAPMVGGIVSILVMTGVIGYYVIYKPIKSKKGKVSD
ncbi:YfhO family protein [Enterococcus sp. 669A]|uniref:YfhO family protein n=1 Tax=Candidatus Enterococcus moelleringii TaxID=2815325 RepID=A0ABS3LE53_9ENTE|nr:YfhO family protein [Enterococcus sp. 669A]MBO1307900.1 YfhO family protein [Enterococcus sp. 669A]